MHYQIKYNMIGGNINNTIKICNGIKESNWKKTLDWNNISNDEVITANGSHINQTWAASDIYNNTYHVHGTINQYRYGGEGISACTMMSLYAGYKMLNTLNLEENVNINFIDECINTGRQLYQDFLKTPEGNSLIRADNKTPHTSIDEILKFFKSKHNIDEIEPTIRQFEGYPLPNIENYDKYYPDKSKNHACIITAAPETYCLFFDIHNNKVYLFDSHGRGNNFFDIPKSENQEIFVNQKTKNQESIPYSNSNAFIVKADEYKNIKNIIKKIGIPYSGDSDLMYITLN